MGRAKKDEPASLVTKEVYYRCIWAVRDAERMRILAQLSEADLPDIPVTGINSEGTARNGRCAYVYEGRAVSDAAIYKAAEELRCIEEALHTVPEVYRRGVYENIAHNSEFSDLAHPNTWKKWKQSFIYELARRMHFI